MAEAVCAGGCWHVELCEHRTGCSTIAAALPSPSGWQELVALARVGTVSVNLTSMGRDHRHVCWGTGREAPPPVVSVGMYCANRKLV